LLSRVKPSSNKLFFEETIKTLVQGKILDLDGDRVRLAAHRITLSPDLVEFKQKITDALLSSPYNPPDEKEILQRLGEKGATVLQVLIEAKDVVRLEEGILFHQQAIEKAKEQMRSYFMGKKEATVSELRQCLGTTRKYAVPLMEYLDRIGFTEREGDIRKLKIKN
jgi:selenocysteine-specific elongation factor